MMLKKMIPMVVALGAAMGLAQAGPSSNVTYDIDTMRMIWNADADKGKSLVATCAGCHGAAGVSAAPNMPSLAGQTPEYNYKQLKDFKDGKRTSSLMAAFVQALSEQNMADISAFYANQPVPPASGKGGSISLPVSGDGNRMIPACNSCHAEPRFRKHHGAPILDGQHGQYLSDTLKAYKSGKRANDVYSVMRSIAVDLTDQEIQDLAAYYAARGSK